MLESCAVVWCVESRAKVSSDRSARRYVGGPPGRFPFSLENGCQTRNIISSLLPSTPEIHQVHSTNSSLMFLLLPKGYPGVPPKLSPLVWLERQTFLRLFR